jgi:hypothetical protein
MFLEYVIINNFRLREIGYEDGKGYWDIRSQQAKPRAESGILVYGIVSRISTFLVPSWMLA